ncbi:hypothetical protein COCON_G00128320 [Conger conger]|uniref:Uncharacterized protein n=1 Tax=Conger conger TaxID=82655 RepID=A0A9Q1DE01_CONCO|nr:hypothetical protein COCON_G00128320 [Conger conger]
MEDALAGRRSSLVLLCPARSSCEPKFGRHAAACPALQLQRCPDRRTAARRIPEFSAVQPAPAVRAVAPATWLRSQAAVKLKAKFRGPAGTLPPVAVSEGRRSHLPPALLPSALRPELCCQTNGDRGPHSEELASGMRPTQGGVGGSWGREEARDKGRLAVPGVAEREGESKRRKVLSQALCTELDLRATQIHSARGPCWCNAVE